LSDRRIVGGRGQKRSEGEKTKESPPTTSSCRMPWNLRGNYCKSIGRRGEKHRWAWGHIRRVPCSALPTLTFLGTGTEKERKKRRGSKETRLSSKRDRLFSVGRIIRKKSSEISRIDERAQGGSSIIGVFGVKPLRGGLCRSFGGY